MNYENTSPFDTNTAQHYTRVRQAFIQAWLAPLRAELELGSALDVGCGVGYFSKFLFDMGFHVTGLDGRQENATESRRRYPEIEFLTRDIEDPTVAQVGNFDFILCAGLLYHLENPFRAIRNLHALTERVLFVETMCAPGENAEMRLLDEEHYENQGLNYVAFYPTEPCLLKMFYRAGFPFVYGFPRLPDHEYFRSSLGQRRRRTMLVASKQRLNGSSVRLLPEPPCPWDIWTTRSQIFWARLDRTLSPVRWVGRQVLHPRRGSVKE